MDIEPIIQSMIQFIIVAFFGWLVKTTKKNEKDLDHAFKKIRELESQMKAPEHQTEFCKYPEK